MPEFISKIVFPAAMLGVLGIMAAIVVHDVAKARASAPERFAMRKLVPDPSSPLPDPDLNAHEAILGQGHRDAPDVLFLGDDLIAGWGGVPELWQRAFAGFHPTNAGINGDRIEHVLWRVKHGVLAGIHPRLIVLEVGANNLVAYPDDPNLIVSAMTHLVRVIRDAQPDAKVLVIGLFPRQDDLAPVIARVNKDLSAIADGDHVSFLDTGANLTPDEFQDGFHLTVAAYRKWAGQIGTALEQLHALPASPTDPSDR